MQTNIGFRRKSLLPTKYSIYYGPKGKRHSSHRRSSSSWSDAMSRATLGTASSRRHCAAGLVLLPPSHTLTIHAASSHLLYALRGLIDPRYTLYALPEASIFLSALLYALSGSLRSHLLPIPLCTSCFLSLDLSL